MFVIDRSQCIINCYGPVPMNSQFLWTGPNALSIAIDRSQCIRNCYGPVQMHSQLL